MNWEIITLVLSHYVLGGTIFLLTAKSLNTAWGGDSWGQTTLIVTAGLLMWPVLLLMFYRDWWKNRDSGR